MKLLRNDKITMIALIFLLAFALTAATSSWWAGGLKMNLDDRLHPPLSGSFMGTDALGRNVMSRLFLAARTSLALSGAVVALSAVLGTTLGLTAGYLGGKVDALIMSVTDAALGFPALLLALTVMYVLGPSAAAMIAVLTFARWMMYARVARTEAMRLRKAGWTVASKAVGATRLWVMRKHVFPGMASVLAVLAATELSAVMLSESTLTFLGLGIQPPDVSLGLLVAQGVEYMNYAGWLVLFPGLAVFLIGMSCCVLAGWLAVAMEPSQRWRLQ